MARDPRAALLALAVGFGGAEAALVVVLRRLVDPTGDLFPLVTLPPDLLQLERLREAATLLVLGAGAWLAGRSAAARFAGFLLVFGAWDVVYYAALRAALGWPGSLGDLDLLFLLPVPWFGPVWAPLTVAVTMCICGWRALAGEIHGTARRVGLRHWLAAAVGGAIVVSSFLCPDGTPPVRYPVERLVVGLAIGIAAFANLQIGRARLTGTAPADGSG